MLVAIFIIYMREPSLFSGPRFWAEEGSIYFSYAFGHSWFQALFRPHFGYFSLFNNIASVFAVNLVPLRYAPLVTTLMAFVLQVVPLVIILWGESDFWDSTTRRVLGILIVLFTPLSGEIWLNTVNSQFYLGLITFLILMEDVINIGPYKKWFYRGLLVLSGLTGSISCFLLPLFAIKAWQGKRREEIVQASILFACCILQLAIIWTTGRGHLGSRVAGVDPFEVISVISVQTIILPLLGGEIANAFADMLEGVRSSSNQQFRMLSLVLFGCGIGFFWYISVRLASKRRLMILGSYFLIVVLSIVTSIGQKFTYVNPGAGSRYFYLPSVILMILILSNIRLDERFKMLRSALFASLLTISLISGMNLYMRIPLAHKSWPKWSEEVLRWQEDPEYMLKIWPPGWEMKLNY